MQGHLTLVYMLLLPDPLVGGDEGSQDSRNWMTRGQGSQKIPASSEH